MGYHVHVFLPYLYVKSVVRSLWKKCFSSLTFHSCDSLSSNLILAQREQHKRLLLLLRWDVVEEEPSPKNSEILRWTLKFPILSLRT